MADKNLVNSIVDYGLQVFINTSAVFGICLLWANFNGKAYETILRLAAAPLTWPSDEKKKKEEE